MAGLESRCTVEGSCAEPLLDFPANDSFMSLGPADVRSMSQATRLSSSSIETLNEAFVDISECGDIMLQHVQKHWF